MRIEFSMSQVNATDFMSFVFMSRSGSEMPALTSFYRAAHFENEKKPHSAVWGLGRASRYVKWLEVSWQQLRMPAGQKAGVVIHRAVAEGVGLHQIDFRAIAALDGHRGVVSVDDR